MQNTLKQRLSVFGAVAAIGILVCIYFAYARANSIELPQENAVAFEDTISTPEEPAKPTWVDFSASSWAMGIQITPADGATPVTTSTVGAAPTNTANSRVLRALVAALGMARDGQVLTFKNGSISWQNPLAIHGAAVDGLQHQPGYGRIPFEENSSRRVGGGGNGGSTSTSSSSGGGTGDLTSSEADADYVNVTGDTMVGGLVIQYDGLGLNVTGTASGKVIHAEQQFTSSGASIFDANVRFNSSVTLNGVTYIFPGGDGTGSGKVLKTNGAGQLSWTDDNTVGTGLSQSTGDDRYVNQSGDTMTGALIIRVTGGVDTTLGLRVINSISGAILHAEKNLTSSGTLVVNGATRLKSTVTILGTTSGSIIHAERTLTSSGTLTFEGAASGASLYVATSMNGAGLVDCDTAGSSKLLWDSSTGRFSCGTDQSGSSQFSNTGSLEAYFNSKYVNTSGDTMTGALIINLNSGHLGLRVIQTASGRHLHAEQDLTSSGTLKVVSTARFSSGVIISRAEDKEFIRLRDTTNSKNISLLTGSGSPESIVTAEPASMYFDSQNGKIYKKNTGTSSTGWVELTAGSGSLHMAKMTRNSAQSIPNQAYSKVYFDTEEFDIGNIANVTAGASGSGRITIAKAGRYLVTAFFRPTNNSSETHVSIYKNNTAIVLGGQDHVGTTGRDEVTATDIISLNAGDYLEAFAYQRTGAADNTPTGVEARPRFSVIQLQDNQGGNFWTLSGSNIYSNNAGFVGIGTTLNPKAKLDVVGTISGANLLISGNATISGSLVVKSTVKFLGTTSGSIIHAEKTLTSSGGLVFEGTASGANLYVATSINGAGLVDCDTAGSSKLLWDSTTGRFSCGSDQTGGAGTFGSGNVLTIGDARYLKLSGGTLTGTTIVNITNGNVNTVGLKVLNTMSGAVVHGEKSLTSSGTLVWEGAASGATMVVSGQFSGAGLSSDCSGTGSFLQWNSTTKRFQCSSNAPWVIEKNSDESVISSTNLQNDDELYFSMAANKAYMVDIMLLVRNSNSGSDTAGGFKLSTSMPAGANRRLNISTMNGSGSTSETNCFFNDSTTAGQDVCTAVAAGSTFDALVTIRGIVQTSSTAGNFQLTWAQATSADNKTTIRKNSTLSYTVLAGAADLAEVYYTNDTDLRPGMIVSIDGSLESGVRKSIGKGDKSVIGVVSTKPNYVMGTIENEGLPVSVALAGRVPVFVSGENGPINAGDYLGPSSMSGVAMRVSTGSVVAQALTEYTGSGVGLVNAFLKNLDLGDGARILAGSGSIPSAFSGSVNIGSLLSPGALNLVGSLTVQGFAEFLGDVKVGGELSVSEKQAGTLTIGAGNGSARLTFKSSWKAIPIVNVTPYGRVGVEWWADDITQDGFTVKLAGPADTSVTFGWSVLGIAPHAAAPESGSGSSSSSSSEPDVTVFPINEFGQPTSSDPAWNSCIQGTPEVLSDGQPVNCARYHDGTTWHHPDLGIDFTYDPTQDPTVLVLPPGYTIQIVDQSEVSSSSSSSSSESPEESDEESSVPEETSGSGSTLVSE